MKKLLALTLVGLMSLNGITAWGLESKANIINNIDISTITTFNDVQKHWSKPYVTKLLATGIISGYDDGTFKPERTTTRGELLRMLISALHEDVGVSKERHWATNYENVAIEKGYLTKAFDSLDKAITREEISILVSRAMKEVPSNLEEMKKVFNDYPEDAEIVNHIAKIAGLGIIKGDKGEFRPGDSATRAEVSTILIRILDPSEREIPVKVEKPVDKNAFIEPKFQAMHYSQLVENGLGYASTFKIILANYNDYDENYSVKTECLNVPQLNLVDNGIWGYTDVFDRVDLTEWRTITDGFKRSGGSVRTLSRKFYTTRDNIDKIKIYEGMELQFKITLKKGNISKDYYKTVVVEEVVQ